MRIEVQGSPVIPINYLEKRRLRRAVLRIGECLTLPIVLNTGLGWGFYYRLA